MSSHYIFSPESETGYATGTIKSMRIIKLYATPCINTFFYPPFYFFFMSLVALAALQRGCQGLLVHGRLWTTVTGTERTALLRQDQSH